VAALQSQMPRLTAAGIKVVVISFGARQGALAWLQDTACNLDLFLDQERRLYRALGLHRSLAKVWNMATVHYYAGQKAKGNPLPQPVADVEDDPLQMGGDFTVRCRDGVLLLCHPSSHPRDRPTLATILANVVTDEG